MKDKSGKTLTVSGIREFLEKCHIPVEIADLSPSQGHINHPLFPPEWSEHSPNTIAIDEGYFEPAFLKSDETDKREAASVLIHELAHWVEAICLKANWMHTAKGKKSEAYDTGQHAQRMIRSKYYKKPAK